MSWTTSTYFIEVKEGEHTKLVPHTKGKNYCEFFSRTDAVNHLKKVVEKYTTKKFRLVKKTVTYTNEKWLTKKIVDNPS